MELQRGEMWMNLLVIKGLELREPVPALDELVVPEDLESLLPELPIESSTSSGV
jgi:hypothetical protein